MCYLGGEADLHFILFIKNLAYNIYTKDIVQI
jgi:hypothetical protein